MSTAFARTGRFAVAAMTNKMASISETVNCFFIEDSLRDVDRGETKRKISSVRGEWQARQLLRDAESVRLMRAVKSVPPRGSGWVLNHETLPLRSDPPATAWRYRPHTVRSRIVMARTSTASTKVTRAESRQNWQKALMTKACRYTSQRLNRNISVTVTAS